MRKALWITLVVLLGGAFLIGYGTGGAQSDLTTVTLTNVRLGVGNSGIVEGHIQCAAAGCSAFDITIMFDPAVVQVDSAEIGPYLGTQIVTVLNDVDNTNGRVQIAAAVLGAWQPTEETLLFSLNVTGVQAGETAFSIIALDVADDVGNPLQSVGISGVVIVDVGAAPTLTTEPVPTATEAPETDIFPGSPNSAWTPVAQDFNGVAFVKVPAGCFLMGSEEGNDNEKPVHEICLSAFWIMQTEVTRAMVAECVAAGACAEPPSSEYSTRDNQPVNRVPWLWASDYCAWIDGRLPTEAEWEYAARGPESWAYPWGNDFVARRAVYRDNSENLTADVGSKLTDVSWVGALDMSGNVAEWVADWYRAAYYSELQAGAPNPQGPMTGDLRVVRGGSFVNHSASLRAALRNRIDPDLNFKHIGFRCARSE